MVRGQAPILLRGQVKKNDTAQWRRWGKKSKVLKPSLVTASYSAALGTLRKQTWRNKSISFKSFLFQSFQLVGHFVSLDLRSLLSGVLLDSSQANLFPVFFCDWLISSVLMPKPLFPLCQPRFIISFKSSTELPWWSSCWESACQCRGHRLDPCSRRTPELDLCASATELAVPGASAPQQE